MFALAFTLTVLFELAALLAVKRFTKLLRREKRIAWHLLAVNAFSHPIVWFGFPWLWNQYGLPVDSFTYLFNAEMFAVVSEALIYHAFNAKTLGFEKALALSTALNMFSFVFGGWAFYALLLALGPNFQLAWP
ncbi:MAG TPA: hypothetical protein VJA40_00780 [archaeon]|nr:hypothetical protein [archaeon]